MSEPIPVPDPRRWATLAVVVVAALIVVLDNSVLIVAIPTILRDFHTTLPAVEWVITGYSLTFASLLIIGGRLGDVFGHRRIFVIGAALFGTGSLLAALSWNVPTLLVQESIRNDKRAGEEKEKLGRSTRNSGLAMLEFARAVEDAQYGLRGVINNVPTLVGKVPLSPSGSVRT